MITGYPGDTLEAWVGDVYPPKYWAEKLAELEPAREYVEDVVLPKFWASKMPWREYRDWLSAFVEHVAEQRKDGQP